MAACLSPKDCWDVDGEPAIGLLLLADAAYARRVQRSRFPENAPNASALFDCRYRWLRGMSGDGVLAGPSGSVALTGCEIDPFATRERIEAAMAPDRVEAHLARFRALTAA